MTVLVVFNPAPSAQLIHGLAIRRTDSRPRDCQVKLRTIGGAHWKGLDGSCPNCGWKFPVSDFEISGQFLKEGQR